jgi:hypothetical protein
MNSILDPIYLPYTLLTSLLVRGIYTGEISKLGWLIRSEKHADTLHFLYQLLISVSACFTNVASDASTGPQGMLQMPCAR